MMVGKIKNGIGKMDLVERKILMIDKKKENIRMEDIEKIDIEIGRRSEIRRILENESNIEEIEEREEIEKDKVFMRILRVELMKGDDIEEGMLVKLENLGKEEIFRMNKNIRKKK